MVDLSAGGQRVIARNHVTTCGPPSAPAVVFLHGFGSDQSAWASFVPAFARDHRVVLLDHVGAGASQVSAYDRGKYATLEGYVDDLLEVIAVLELHEVVVVAHSISAMMAIVASVRAPDLFERLVLVAPSPCYVDDPATGYVGGFSREDIEELLVSVDANYVAWAQAIAPMVMGNPDAPELAQGLATSFQATDPDIARHFARVTFLSDIRHLLGEVSVPALILQCSGDIMAPAQVGAYLHAHLAASTLVALAASGHCPHLSAPQQTLAAITSYLDPVDERALAAG